MTRILTLASLLLITTACSQMNSSDIKSSGIHASNSVSATNGQVTCESTLRAGGSTGTYVDLDGSDVLYCNNVRMSREGDIFGQVSYRARVPSSPRALYEIILVREGETLVSGAVMPSPISGARIEGGQTHTIGQNLTVTWDRSQYTDESTTAVLMMKDSSEKQFDSSSKRDSAPEAGRVTFTGDDTVIRAYREKTNSYEQIDGPYTMTIQLRREKAGALQGAWKGSMNAQQTVVLEGKLVE